MLERAQGRQAPSSHAGSGDCRPIHYSGVLNTNPAEDRPEQSDSENGRARTVQIHGGTVLQQRLFLSSLQVAGCAAGCSELVARLNCY
jgi:hypothetical protein